MGKFPYSIIGTSEDLFMEFVSSLAGPLLNTGFHFNVGNWPGHVETAGSRNGTCDWVLTSEDLADSGDSEGIFLSVAHWYPPHTTSCRARRTKLSDSTSLGESIKNACLNYNQYLNIILWYYYRNLLSKFAYTDIWIILPN